MEVDKNVRETCFNQEKIEYESISKSEFITKNQHPYFGRPMKSRGKLEDELIEFEVNVGKKYMKIIIKNKIEKLINEINQKNT